uniref:Uncharacterized protein n=1 Tax=Anopheles minimus TaxID=112268 RepID=A0A182WMR6_9DIPT
MVSCRRTYSGPLVVCVRFRKREGKCSSRNPFAARLPGCCTV